MGDEYVFIIVHGSGHNNMDGEIAFGDESGCYFERYTYKKLAVYKELCDALNAQGFSTLRYEKRMTLNPVHYVSDLNKLIDGLKGMDNMKDRKLVLYGWSEGVSIALNSMMMHKNDIYACAGYGGVFNDIVALEANKLYNEYVECEKKLKKAETFKSQFLSKISEYQIQNDSGTYEDVEITGKYNIEVDNYSSFSETTPLGYTPKYYHVMDSLIRVSVKILKKSDIPILLMHGGKDIKVPPDQHYFINNEIDNKSVTLKLVGNTDHFLRNIDDTSLNTEIYNIIKNWIHSNEF